MKQVIVTGPSGFIGQHVVQHLLDAGWQVHGIARATSDVDQLCQAGMQVHACDLPPADVFQQVGAVDAVVHCAAAYGRDSSNVSSVVETNVLLPLRWLEAAVSAEVSMFVHLDTCFSLSYPYLRPYTLSKKQMVAWGAEIAGTSGICFRESSTATSVWHWRSSGQVHSLGDRAMPEVTRADQADRGNPEKGLRLRDRCCSSGHVSD